MTNRKQPKMGGGGAYKVFVSLYSCVQKLYFHSSGHVHLFTVCITKQICRSRPFSSFVNKTFGILDHILTALKIYTLVGTFNIHCRPYVDVLTLSPALKFVKNGRKMSLTLGCVEPPSEPGNGNVSFRKSIRKKIVQR